MPCIDDPYFSCDALAYPRTVLRLHADDEPRDQHHALTQAVVSFDGGTAVDRSPRAAPMVLFGGAAVTTTRSLWGSTAYENTSSDVESSARIALPFDVSNLVGLSIEVAAYATALGGSSRHILCIGSTAGDSIRIFVNSAGLLAWRTNAAGLRTTTTTMPLNQWVRLHLALQPTSPGNHNSAYFFDGIRMEGTPSGFILAPMTGASICIGTQFSPAANEQWLGSIAEVRVTTAFRPQEGCYANHPLFPAALAERGDTNAADCSCASPKTVTYAGDASPCPANFRFGPGSFWIPALETTNATENGLIVSGHGDFSFGTNDFAIRFWVFRFSNIRAGCPFWGTVAGGEMSISWGSPGYLTIRYRSSAGPQEVTITDGTATPALNVWHQFIVQRRGNTWETYLDGALIDSRAVTGGSGSTVAFTGPLYFGRRAEASNAPINGYMDEIDILAGAAMVSGNYTPDSLPMCCAELQTFWPAGCHAWPGGAVAL